MKLSAQLVKQVMKSTVKQLTQVEESCRFIFSWIIRICPLRMRFFGTLRNAHSKVCNIQKKVTQMVTKKISLSLESVNVCFHQSDKTHK